MKKRVIRAFYFIIYLLFLAFSSIYDFQPGIAIRDNFISFAFDMLRIVPVAFILIGLFEVWVKKSTVEKHMGEGSVFMGYVWAILLAGTTVGGLYVAFPVAYSLYRKGAKLSVIFTYVSAAAVYRIPMTIFEASFMGIKFTLVRLIVSLPLIILTSVILGSYLKRRGFEINEGK